MARDRLVVQTWAENRLWEDEQTLKQSGPGAVAADAGEVQLGSKTYAWQRDVEEKEPGLSALTLTVRWVTSGQARQDSYISWVAAGVQK